MQQVLYFPISFVTGAASPANMVLQFSCLGQGGEVCVGGGGTVTPSVLPCTVWHSQAYAVTGCIMVYTVIGVHSHHAHRCR